jgi:hypothetical protein
VKDFLLTLLVGTLGGALSGGFLERWRGRRDFRGAVRILEHDLGAFYGAHLLQAAHRREGTDDQASVPVLSRVHWDEYRLTVAKAASRRELRLLTQSLRAG